MTRTCTDSFTIYGYVFLSLPFDFVNFQIHPVHRILKATLPAKHCTEARTFNWFARVAVVIRPHNWFGIKMVLKYEWPTGKLLLLLFNAPRIKYDKCAHSSPQSGSESVQWKFFFLVSFCFFCCVCSVVFSLVRFALRKKCAAAVGTSARECTVERKI